jgi:hypothetical protein
MSRSPRHRLTRSRLCPAPRRTGNADRGSFRSIPRWNTSRRQFGCHSPRRHPSAFQFRQDGSKVQVALLKNFAAQAIITRNGISRSGVCGTSPAFSGSPLITNCVTSGRIPARRRLPFCLHRNESGARFCPACRSDWAALPTRTARRGVQLQQGPANHNRHLPLGRRTVIVAEIEPEFTTDTNALDSVTIEVVCRDCGTGQCRPIGSQPFESDL